MTHTGAGADDTYALLELLERLESLREDMDELGIRTRDELEERIRALHEQLDVDEEGDGPDA